MTSSWTAHPLLASPTPTGRVSGATPIIPADTAAGSSRSVRAGSAPQRSQAVTKGSDEPQVIDPFRFTQQISFKRANQIVVPKVADLGLTF
jgi:hypothetical protein